MTNMKFISKKRMLERNQYRWLILKGIVNLGIKLFRQYVRARSFLLGQHENPGKVMSCVFIDEKKNIKCTVRD